MNFYNAIIKDGKINYIKVELDINEFVNNEVTPGVSKIDDAIFITERMLEDIIHGKDRMSTGMFNVDWSRTKDLIGAHLNWIFIKENDIKPLVESDFMRPDAIDALKIKLPHLHHGQYAYIAQDPETEKSIYHITIEQFPYWPPEDWD